jgi:hypothetical protein
MRKFGLLATAALVSASGLFADSITSTGTFVSFGSSGFSSGQANPTSGVAGNPFWNNYSPDIGFGGSNDMNIGYALTGTGGFTASILGGDSAANTLLGTSGADPSAFTFDSNGDLYTIQVLFSDTGLPGNVTLGWYDVSNPSVLNPIFSNVANTSTPLTAQSFSPGVANYGFYATVCFNPPTCDITATYYTDSGENTTPDEGVSTAYGVIGDITANRFALFNLNSNAQSYVLGLSEAPNTNGTEQAGDFQDLVVQLTDDGPAGVPEPATLSIVGAGLIGLGFARRRRVS